MKICFRGVICGIAAWAFVLGCAGCATNLPSYTGGTASPTRSLSNHGLVLRADPFTDRERAETYFKMNPSDKGIAIIHLHAKNQSADATWLLTEQRMMLVDNSTAVNQGVKNVLTSYNDAGFAGALLVSPLLIQMGYTQTFVEKNLVDKEWRNQTLSPGQSAEGFLYFTVAKGVDWSKKMSLRIEGLNVRNSQTNVFLVPLTYEPH